MRESLCDRLQYRTPWYRITLYPWYDIREPARSRRDRRSPADTSPTMGLSCDDMYLVLR